MSRKVKTSKVIPQEIRRFIIARFNKTSGEIKLPSGKRSKYLALKISIDKFLNEQKGKNELVLTNFDHYQGVAESKIQRAFGSKGSPIATFDLRNLLSYYATYGKQNWNELILDKFPQYIDLLDGSEFNKISGPELQFIKRQISDNIPNIDHPEKPEFPPEPFYTPKFPATKTYKIDVPGFNNVYLKDESTNPTGTHKDRMAWEIKLKAERYNLKEISIISSGSSAVAIQFMFNLYNIPTKLRVLVDEKIDNNIIDTLKKTGCIVTQTKLNLKELKGKEIREITENKKGIDITYRETMDLHNIQYYDWMSYEILNVEPEFCFIPFGTGDLYSNILNIVRKEYTSRHLEKDQRFLGSIKKITECHFLGATTDNENSKLDKLFSYFLPSRGALERMRTNLITHKCIGNMSKIYNVDEKYVEESLIIAGKQKIMCEPSGIAGLALLLQMREIIPPDKKILIVNTGRTIYDPEIPVARKIYDISAKKDI